MRGLRFAETIVARAGQGGAWLLLVLALAQAAILVARKLGFASIAAQEIVAAMAVPVVLLSIPWAHLERRHVAVEAAPRRWAKPTGHVLALAFALVFLWFSVPYAWAAWQAGEGSYEFAGFGWRWLAKAVLPLFAALLAVQAIASLLRR